MKSVRQKREPKPVKEIEISEKHIKVKVIVFIVVMVIAIAAFTVGIVSCLSADKGWNKVESNAALDCSKDFSFYYYLEKGGTKGHTRLKEVSIIYTQACYDAYALFEPRGSFDGYKGVSYLNAHPNEEVTVDPVLYDAFSAMKNDGNRALYLAPVYSYYNSVLLSTSDEEAQAYYPVAEKVDSFDELMGFASDSGAIDLELLGDNKVKLCVSGEYRSYAYLNGIDAYIDFFQFKNAFIADFIAQRLKEGGCKTGTLSSNDGFMRTLENVDVSSSVGIYDYNGGVCRAADIEFVGDAAAVRMRDFSVGIEYGLYYVFDDGTTVSKYVDHRDGTLKSSISGITAYGYGKTCGEIALELYPVFVADEFDKTAIDALKLDGIYSVYCENNVVTYNDDSLKVNNLLASGDVVYTAKQV